MKIVVTGGAGFIGSHLVDALMDFSFSHEVIVIDNLSSGSVNNVAQHLKAPNFKLVVADLKKDSKEWFSAMEGSEALFHFAANPEVRISSVEPRIHFNENILVTFNLLEAARKADVDAFVFASSSTVYGETNVIPTPEDHPKRPISVYGASKLACEALIETYHRLYGIKTLSLRYANIVGPRMTHGVIVDFIRKLRANPKELEILGDGTQKKSYLHVKDAVDATLHLFNKLLDGEFSCEAFNVGSEDWIRVVRIADIIVEEMGLKNVKYVFKPVTKDGRAWPGDVKLMLLDIRKLKSTGWSPTMNSEEAVRETVKSLLKESTI